MAIGVAACLRAAIPRGGGVLRSEPAEGDFGWKSGVHVSRGAGIVGHDMAGIARDGLGKSPAREVGLVRADTDVRRVGGASKILGRRVVLVVAVAGVAPLGVDIDPAVDVQGAVLDGVVRAGGVRVADLAGIGSGVGSAGRESVTRCAASVCW